MFAYLVFVGAAINLIGTLSYIGGFISALTGFVAIKIWNFSSVAFLIYLLLMDGSITYLIYRKKIFKKQIAKIK